MGAEEGELPTEYTEYTETDVGAWMGQKKAAGSRNTRIGESWFPCIPCVPWAKVD
jgi:hypothetical protein